MEKVKQYLGRHFPKPWWMYERSAYRHHRPETFHLRHDPLAANVDGVRRAAGVFWWSWFWSGAWAGVAGFFVAVMDLPLWPCVAVFVLGEPGGRCSKDEQRALATFKAAEAELRRYREEQP